MQGEKTYGVYVRDEREGAATTFSSSDFPEIGTGEAVERIIPLYIGYGGETE
jgi:hypothetical protein